MPTSQSQQSFRAEWFQQAFLNDLRRLRSFSHPAPDQRDAANGPSLVRACGKALVAALHFVVWLALLPVGLFGAVTGGLAAIVVGVVALAVPVLAISGVVELASRLLGALGLS